MAAIEPFFFHTQGHGVIYLAFQYAGQDEYSGQTYIATGAFQNINTKDSKRIYYLDGRYTDVMNDASIFGKTNVANTQVHTKAQAKKMIKDYGLHINPDRVTLYSHSDFYWFVEDGILPKSKSPNRTRSKKSKNSANKTINKTIKKSRKSAPKRSTSKSASKKRKYNT